MRVLITGAGIAGLASAVALRRAGINDLTIVEHAPEVAAQKGIGIAIPPNGTRALTAVSPSVERLIARGCANSASTASWTRPAASCPARI